ERLKLPERYRHIEAWQMTEFRSNQVITLPRPGQAPGHLLLVATSELPMAFYTGTLTASLGILIFSVLLWLVIARQIKRLI
ncbi:PAS domain-containing sensor histidine kinase, partial [Pseudomonas sp. SIMBA_068]